MVLPTLSDLPRNPGRGLLLRNAGGPALLERWKEGTGAGHVGGCILSWSCLDIIHVHKDK